MSLPPLRRILHVDDSDDIRELVRHGFEKAGKFELMSCGSSAEALAAAPEFEPDLLLLDSLMPDISGVELIRKIKANPALAETPVILLTTQAETMDFRTFIEVGAIDVIGKPFDVDELPDTLEEIWREHWTGDGDKFG